MPARYPLTLGQAYPQEDEQLIFLEWIPQAWQKYCQAKTAYARVQGSNGPAVIMTSRECFIESPNPELVNGTPLTKETIFGYAFADGEHCPYEGEPRSLFAYTLKKPWWKFWP